MKPILEIKNIETYYGLVLAIQGVSLAIAKGSITAILGSNGAGKTTLLKTTLGLLDDQPDKGTIYFCGKRIDGRAAEKIVRMGMGYVPEGREMFPELTVRESLLMGAYARKDKKNIALDIDRVFAYFPDLQKRQRQLAGTLSGGQQQMLAIARALMNGPRLLLMDEPSLGLSPLLVREIFAIIKKINKEGISILLVEQNANMALRVADFGYVMENGRFVVSGTAEELLQDKDVQEFYLGVSAHSSAEGYQRWKRKKRWR